MVHRGRSGDARTLRIGGRSGEPFGAIIRDEVVAMGPQLRERMRDARPVFRLFRKAHEDPDNFEPSPHPDTGEERFPWYRGGAESGKKHSRVRMFRKTRWQLTSTMPFHPQEDELNLTLPIVVSLANYVATGVANA